MELLSQYGTYVIAAIVVIGLLVGLLMVMKRVSGKTRGRQGNRLGISEYHIVDEQRRLVIVRRDNVEHLLLIGGEQDLVVESNIRSRAPSMDDDEIGRDHRASAAPELRVEPPSSSQAVPLRPAPRAPVFTDRRPQLRSVETTLAPPPRKFDDE